MLHRATKVEGRLNDIIREWAGSAPAATHFRDGNALAGCQVNPSGSSWVASKAAARVHYGRGTLDKGPGKRYH